MPIPYFIAQGIPKRIGATRCLLGTLRSSPEAVDADDGTTDYSNVVGCSPRNPEHGVVGEVYEGETEAENYAMVTGMTPYSSYPSKLISSTEDEGTHLVIKARGEISRDESSGEWLFPKIKLTLRPLMSRLDYEWTRDACAIHNANAVTFFGDEMITSTHGEDVNGESISYDFDFMYQWQAPFGGAADITEIDPNTGDIISGSIDPNAYNNRFVVNKQLALEAFVERGGKAYLQGDFYYKAADRPPNLDPKYSPPLQPQEIDLTLYPRADGEEAYEFKINESWDLRYRFPTWWNSNGTSPEWFEDSQYPQGAYIWYAPVDLPSSNPFESSFLGGIPQRLVPVEKYIRVQNPSSGFPYQWNTNYAFPSLNELHADQQIQSITRVRKRYPYSFKTLNSDTPQSFWILDSNKDNWYDYVDSYTPSQSSETFYFIGTANVAYLAPFFAERVTDQNGYLITNRYPARFDCQSWWRMEIETERCEWNFDESLEDGWTIKGFIEFGKKLLREENSAQGYGNKGLNQDFEEFFDGIRATNGVWRAPAYGFLNTDPENYDSAGSVPFEVKVTKDNALGKPVIVMDFPIGGTVLVPDGEGGYTPVQYGDEPERSVNFITDFYITEIIPPQPPED